MLWSADGPLPPAEIKGRLTTDLAYTSVATVLGRLHAKGLVRRSEAGRAFEYEAAVDESTTTHDGGAPSLIAPPVAATLLARPQP